MQAATLANPEVATTASQDAGQVWHLGLTSALSKPQMWGLYLGLVLLLQLIGLGFSLVGAEMILGFAWLELMAIGGVLWWYTQHMQDTETLRLTPTHLSVELTQGQKTSRYRFTRQWVQVHLTPHLPPLLRIQEGTQSVEIGRHVPVHARAALARQLRTLIQEKTDV